MNPIPVIAVIAYRLGKQVFGDHKLSSTEVDEWIKYHGNRNNYGRGYTGCVLPPQSASGGFVELRRESIGDGRVRVIASVFFDPRSLQPADSKTWTAGKLDKKLNEQFGKNLRIRVSI